MLELAACRSAPAQAVRLARARRLRHLTLLPWSVPQSLRERVLVRSVSRTSRQRFSLRNSLAEIVVAVGTHATPTSFPRLDLLAQVRDCASRPFGRRLAPPCFVHGQVFEGVIDDGAGQCRCRMRLDAVLEAAEDGHVAGLHVRRASWRDEAQHDVRECGPHGGQSGFAGVDAGHVPEKDPRLSFFAWCHHHVVQSGRGVQHRGRRGRAVLRCDVAGALWPGLLRQDGLSCPRARSAPACPAGHGPC